MMADEDPQDEAPEENAEATEGEGGENAEGEDGEEGDAKKSKLPLIIAGVALLLVGGAAAAYFTGMLDSLLGKTPECVAQLDDHGEPVLDDHDEPVMDCPAEDEHGDGHGDEHTKKGDDSHGDGHGGGGGAAFLAIPTMIVNLNTNDGQPRYLRLTVQLEMSSPGDVAAVEAVIPRVVDQFQTYLRELRVRDLRGSAGIYRLETELLWRVNQAAAPTEVKYVLFQEILIQ